MDVISHALWGGVIAGRKNKKNFWWAFVIGFLPDALSFGIFTAMIVLGLASGPDWQVGPPPVGSIPQYVYHLYGFTHSLFIFAVIFGLVWLIRKKPFIPLFAWLTHILIDIPTHSLDFFPTPIFWPFLNNVRFSGISWSQPIIFIPDVILLIIAYLLFFIFKRRKKARE